MSLQIYNSLSKRVEAFEPITPGQVRMYVCGPNLYGPAHVGHALSYTFFDVVRRYLEYAGYQVRHIQNFTDIEDRILDRAQREGRSIFEIASEYLERFLTEMDALNIRRAHAYPRATEVIPKMIEIIQGLIASGHAYVVDGDVYFRVTSFSSYGALSGRTLNQMLAGARIDVDERKEHPMDFALWKAAKPGEPSWDSPWGPGRPGWHIECSAMSMQYLGEQLDIHGGGDDLRFPHHENEIAQSEGFTGKAPFARYWIHNALMKPPVGEEMHRHLGNFVSIRDALAAYEADAIRLFILSAHYRTPLRWTDEGVSAAAKGVDRLRNALANADAAIERAPDLPPEGPLVGRAEEARRAFERAMSNDFGTPQAIAALFDLAAEVNRAVGAALLDDRLQAGGLPAAAAMLRRLAGVLGLQIAQVDLPAETAGALRAMLDELERSEPALVSDGASAHGPRAIVDTLLAIRDRARQARRFDTSDSIRRRLGDLGIIVEDLPGGSRWRVAARKDTRS